MYCNIVLHILLGLPRSLLPEELSVKILKALLSSHTLATCLAHFNLVGLITLMSTNYEVPDCGAFSTHADKLSDSSFGKCSLLLVPRVELGKHDTVLI